MPVVEGPTTVFLSPQVRAAPDQLRQVLHQQICCARNLTVVTRKLADPELVGRIADRCRVGGQVRALMEAGFVREPAPVPEPELWSRGAGVHAEARRCLGALLRSSVDVRLNACSRPRHANILLSGGDSPERVLITSAYLTPGSLDRNFNWCAVIDDPTVALAVEETLRPFFEGDPRGTARWIEVPATDRPAALALGPGSLALESFIEIVDNCQSELRFAFCRIESDSRALHALSRAAERGVRVTGVVDGDQSNQVWDAVPVLRRAGADVRYYPGDRTGAVGRMHLKIAVIDGVGTWMSTANLEEAAEGSFEVALGHPSAPALAAVLCDQIERLHENASCEPLVPNTERPVSDVEAPMVPATFPGV